MKRVIQIHGWEGSPEKDWHIWLKNQLEQKGYTVFLPAMPNPNHPQKQLWLNKLSEVVGKLENTDILVGHSLGCQTILRYLEKMEDGEKVDKVILVAPWNSLSDEIMSDEEDGVIFKSWTEKPIDFEKVKTKASNFIALFSEDDPIVPFEENNKWLNENLEVQTVIYKDKGHFSISNLPEILEFF